MQNFWNLKIAISSNKMTQKAVYFLFFLLKKLFIDEHTFEELY